MVENTAPSSTHEFMKALDSRKKLLRVYTQNIDGLENRVGLTSSTTSEVRELKGTRRTATMTRNVRCVQLHGDINIVRCTLCGFECIWTEECDRVFSEGAAPDCEECERRCRCYYQLYIPVVRPITLLTYLAGLLICS